MLLICVEDFLIWTGAIFLPFPAPIIRCFVGVTSQMSITLCVRSFMSILGGLVDAIDRDTQSLAVKKQQFAELKEDVEALTESHDDCEILDVGGTRFHTRRAVLRGRGEHYFSMWLSGAFASERECDGSLFIDRDPEHFALVLQYLREGTAEVPWDCRALTREAHFYGLSEFIETFGMKSCLTVLPRGLGPAHVYNMDSNTWHCPPSLLSPSGMVYGLTFADGCMMAIVRRTGRILLEALPPGSPDWTTVCELPAMHSCEYAHFVSVGKQLYCVLPRSALVLRYMEGAFLQLPQMATKRSGFGACALGDSIVCAGGSEAGAFAVRTVEQFSSRQQRWEPLPDMAHERRLPGVGLWRGKVIVAGGWDGELRRNTSVEAYDPGTGRWEEMAPLLWSYTWPVVVVCDDALLVVGGLSEGFVAVERYDAEARMWKFMHRAHGLVPDCVAVVPENFLKRFAFPTCALQN